MGGVRGAGAVETSHHWYYYFPSNGIISFPELDVVTLFSPRDEGLGCTVGGGGRDIVSLVLLFPLFTGILFSELPLVTLFSSRDKGSGCTVSFFMRCSRNRCCCCWLGHDGCNDHFL